ncbi:MAG: CarD family transcriptional regulator [Hyphomicrobium sp.]|nr:CarD family transcriptional regulator [Hyphomicrobium sp.]
MAQKKKAPTGSKPAAKVAARKAPTAKVASAAVKTSKVAVKAKVDVAAKPIALKSKSAAASVLTPAVKKPAVASKPVVAAKSLPPKAEPLKAAPLKATPSKVAPVKAPLAAQVAKPAPSVGAFKKPMNAALLSKGAAIAAPQRAVPAASHKPAGQKLTAPVAGKPVAPGVGPALSPKAIAEKTSAARQLLAVQKKPVNQRHGFKANEFVVYPAHGVGRIVGIEEQEIAGMSLELFVITFDKEKLTLRVPTGKLESVGMRKLADEALVKRAMDCLKGRARVKRTMWSRRAQEYVAKINSGDLISIAEVVRDLYRSEAQPEQSYSERQLYEDALDRMARELAAVEKLDERGAVQMITDVLSKSAKSRRAAADGETVVEAA